MGRASFVAELNQAKSLLGDVNFKKAASSSNSFWSAMGRASFVAELNRAKPLLGDVNLNKAVLKSTFWSVIQNENFPSVFTANFKNGKTKFVYSYNSHWSQVAKRCKREPDTV